MPKLTEKQKKRINESIREIDRNIKREQKYPKDLRNTEYLNFLKQHRKKLKSATHFSPKRGLWKMKKR